MGEQEVMADDDVMPRNSFAAYRRKATFLLINRHAEKPELRAVKQQGPELALAQGQASETTNEIKNSAAALSPSEDRK
ncbi:hypothetical protein KMP13_16910 [Epibacterium ulvae]|uniref:hypothetical protein n=1 Tax=Epibacterium ulvae TaxID=1156985 RepID=UPI001BFC74BD|nr:hypothetical protein [Epibacterium ulvae]MBT8155514.1 hypothetical protein [Epibacterium ulvae]